MKPVYCTYDKVLNYRIIFQNGEKVNDSNANMEAGRCQCPDSAQL